MRRTIFVVMIAVAAVVLAGCCRRAGVPAADALLERVGGPGASGLISTVLDTTLASGDEEVFVIGAQCGKPCVKGSSLSALTAGIGWYLNHHAGVNISWNNPQVNLSEIALPVPQQEERHTTTIGWRHYFNYCTFSYSASTWTWERWQQEIDWMALHGINLPLQIVGVEEVWRRTLADAGYTPEEIGSFVAGPAYQAWFQMGNVEGIGGPNPEAWYTRQAWLGRQIADRMRELGMTPVFPGIYFVPSDFEAKIGVRTYDTGKWCNHSRPHLPDADNPRFAVVAADFYRHLQDVLGHTDCFSMDPFHEGLPVTEQGFSPEHFYSRLYAILDSVHPGARWAIQHWQWNDAQRTSLDAVPEGRLIVVDLFADARPAWDRMGNHDVIYSTIFNFGGRTGLFGRIADTARGFNEAVKSGRVKGIGATPEAIGQTPAIYDLLFELPWTDSVDTREWLGDYTVRRYGVDNPHARRAWDLLHSSALACPDSRQGPHEAVMCARPSLEVTKTSTWGDARIFYDPQMVLDAACELLEADLDGANYRYDLADVTRQALSDYSQTVLARAREAHAAADTAAFAAARDEFLSLILDVDAVLATVPDFTLAQWTEGSRRIADEIPGADDAMRDWLDKDNARTLITTWYDREMSEPLHEYSYRQWAGMLSGFYYPRWKEWFDNGMREPEGGWYDWERSRIRSLDPTESVSSADTRTEAARALSKVKGRHLQKRMPPELP